MLDEEARRELEEAFKGPEAEIAKYREKARVEGIPASEVDEHIEVMRLQHIKKIKATFQKHGLLVPNFCIAETPGELMPEIDPDTFKAAWDNYEKHGNRNIGLSAFGAEVVDPDAWAIGFRCTELKMLESIEEEKAGVSLAALKKDGRISETAIRIFAQLPMKKPIFGLQPLPYDLEAFIEEVKNAT